ncbi:hypothetical protein CRUP_030372 [Coryphaenoides rupestris]|nr:hypothetical protein CRUP_030372 [Coryphaenoides rupestris]
MLVVLKRLTQYITRVSLVSCSRTGTCCMWHTGVGTGLVPPNTLMLHPEARHAPPPPQKRHLERQAAHWVLGSTRLAALCGVSPINIININMNIHLYDKVFRSRTVDQAIVHGAETQTKTRQNQINSLLFMNNSPCMREMISLTVLRRMLPQHLPMASNSGSKKVCTQME